MVFIYTCVTTEGKRCEVISTEFHLPGDYINGMYIEDFAAERMMSCEELVER